MKKLNLFVFVIVLFFWSCDTTKEQIPAYVHVKPFVVNVNPNQGTADADIKDVTFFAESEGFLGTYELPATFPVLLEGNSKLLLDPGIRLNGINSTPSIYPFLNRYEINVDLSPNQVDTIQPVTTYDSRVNFAYVEDFETTNTLTVKLDTSQTSSVGTVNDGAFEGKSAKFTVNESNPLFEIASLERMELPTNGDIVYLEMNYKNESLLQVGLVGYKNNNPITTYIIALNPSSEWKKIYVELTQELISVDPGITDFQVLYGAQLQAGQTSADFFIDNVKVLHADI